MAKIRKHHDIFDRRQMTLRVAELKEKFGPDQIRTPLLDLLKETYSQGFEEIKQRCENGAQGLALAKAQSYLTDEIIHLLYDVTSGYVFFRPNPTSSEKLCLAAIGGYGRGEMAPYSDIDLLFLLPYKQTAWGERVVEYMLYMMWDMGLKVGHAVRTVGESIRLAKEDLTINTSLLEARYIWGERPLYDEFMERYAKEVVVGSEPEFIEGKLAERDARHQRMGDSRYVVEPNLKEGKGGLRDLHTLWWIAKYIYNVHSIAEVVKKGVFSPAEYKEFKKAEAFLWTVRCHIHYVAGRPEERITFDIQKKLAERLGYTDRASQSGVERFMKHYFLTAKDVGDLTRIFCAYLEEEHKRRPLLRLPRFGLRKRKVDGFAVEGNRIGVSGSEIFAENPIEMIRIFYVAQLHKLDVHPRALRVIRQNLKRVDGKLRNNLEANQLFLEILTFKEGPGFILRLMNEVGVLGRFIPDFGRVVAQMQYDMYHVYTVDEHTIRALELLSEVERGVLAEDHPLANKIIHKVNSRRVLYVAVLLHDIAKGRKGDHSVLGEVVAKKLCPRLGLTSAETETVAWLVRQHLLMTLVSFKRDLSDPKTVADFSREVQSPERLSLLLVLTVVDIRAVGPKIWNGWKGQLLRDLYYRAEEFLLGGQVSGGSAARIEDVKASLRAKLPDWTDAKFNAYEARFYESYWLALDEDRHMRNAQMIAKSDETAERLTINVHMDEFQDISELTLYAQDHPGLFARMTGAIALSGASIQDAKIFTTRDGMALDTFWIQDIDGQSFKEQRKLDRLKQNIEDILAGKILPKEALGSLQESRGKRTDVFTVEPRVLIDNKVSNTHTVIEINGRDRAGFLFDLSRVMVDLKLSIGSAHVATYGERAVTVFFVRDLFGHKVELPAHIERIEKRLLEVLAANAGPAKKTARRKMSEIS